MGKELREKLEELLQKPLVKLNSKNVEETFEKIAEKLFNNFVIKCGNKIFRFAEIELYYFKENEMDEKWNEITYERDGYNLGDLLFHLSGMDICFNSKLTKNNGKKFGYGGGILIRSILEIKECKESQKDNYEVTVGPLTCVNKMLNACKGGKLPELNFVSGYNCKPINTYRYLGETDFNAIENDNNIDGNLKLAFYDPNIDEKMWNKARSSYYSKRLKRYDIKLTHN